MGPPLLFRQRVGPEAFSRPFLADQPVQRGHVGGELPGTVMGRDHPAADTHARLVISVAFDPRSHWVVSTTLFGSQPAATLFLPSYHCRSDRPTPFITVFGPP